MPIVGPLILVDIVIVPVITAVNIILSLLIFFQDRKAKANKYFISFISCATVWVLFAFLSEFPQGSYLSLLLTKIAITGVTIAVLFLFYFSFSFPRRIVLNKTLGFLISLVGGIIALLTLFTSLIVDHLAIKQWGFDVVYGRLYSLFTVYILLCIGISISTFIRNYIRVEKIRKIQLRFLFLGLFLFIVANIFVQFILREIVDSDIYYRFGNYSIIFFVAFTSYAIIKHHLLNIRVIATELFTALIILVFLIQVLLSESINQLLLRLGMLVLVIFFGALLIRSVLQEVKRREQIQALAERLAEANKHLKALMKMKSEFLTVASHQLRTPTGIVYGMLSMLDEGELTPEETEDFIHKAFIGSKRLQEIIRDLLRATELEAGKMELSLKEIDIKSLVKEIMENLEPKAEEKNLEFVCQVLTRPLPKIKVDISLIKEAITALVDNAINYTPKGCVKIILETKDKNFIVSVKDSGIGISKEDRKRLFVKFSRGKEALAVVPNGTGLGLYIVKIVTDLHKGKIEVKSEGRNKGSTFSIILPMK